MRDFLNRVGSIRWTIALLLLLAGVGAVGTFLPRGQSVRDLEGLAEPAVSKAFNALDFLVFFQSMWLRVLLVLLAVNIIACVIVRIPAIVSAVRGETAVRREPILVLNTADVGLPDVADALKSTGFRERKAAGRRLYSKGTAGYAMTLLAHGSIVVIMISSLAGSISGFVATQRIHIGSTSASAYNWKTEQDMRLPFQIRPVDLVTLPNSVSVRLAIHNVRSGMREGVVNSYVGGTFKVHGLPGSVTLERFDADTRQFDAVWTSRDGKRTRIGRDSEIGDSGLALAPVAYATWPERQVLVKTKLHVDGSIVKTGEISVNHPMKYEGVTIYLVDYGRDQFGFSYAGFQFVNDPGKAGVWAGCVVFIVSLTGALFIRHSCAVLMEEEGTLKVYLSSRDDMQGLARAIRANAGAISDDTKETDT